MNLPTFKLFVLDAAKKMWPKVTAYALLGLACALAAVIFKNLIPEELSDVVGRETASNILDILASSMLAVTTFSLSTMVAAYSAAGSGVSPRAARLITEDKATQNALSTFLGTFVFSLVGIIALNMGAYEGGGRFLLFAVTLAVVVLIVVTFIRWVERLTTLGRASEASKLVEQAATRAMRTRARKPTFGCNRLDAMPDAGPGNHSLSTTVSGYVQYVDARDLSRLAEQHDLDVLVMAMPGAYVHRGSALAGLSRPLAVKEAHSMHKCFTIADQRAFEQDPRFGLCVLSEIASRAASEAVRDNGTAIDIIGRLSRVLEAWIFERKEADTVEFPRLWVPELRAEDLFQDAFNPLAREASRAFEVHARLQKALAYLGTLDPKYRQCAARYSAIALRYVEENPGLPEELAELRRMAAKLRSA